jgi:hypothetical protein
MNIDTAPTFTSALSPVRPSRLNEVLGFEAEDLVANRRGLLSPRQVAHLEQAQRRRQRLLRRACAVIVGIVAAPTAVLAVMAANNNPRPAGAANEPLMGALVGSGFLVLAVLFVAALLASNRPEPVTPTVRTVTGPASIVRVEREYKERNRQTGTVRTRTLVAYELRVGDVVVDVPAGLADVVEQGAAYILYLTADAGRVMAAEPWTSAG